MQAIGYCRFCGQGIGVVVGETATKEKIDLAATMECSCDEARAFQATERKKDLCGGKHQSIARRRAGKHKTILHRAYKASC